MGTGSSLSFFLTFIFQQEVVGVSVWRRLGRQVHLELVRRGREHVTLPLRAAANRHALGLRHLADDGVFLADLQRVGGEVGAAAARLPREVDEGDVDALPWQHLDDPGAERRAAARLLGDAAREVRRARRQLDVLGRLTHGRARSGHWKNEHRDTVLVKLSHFVRKEPEPKGQFSKDQEHVTAASTPIKNSLVQTSSLDPG